MFVHMVSESDGKKQSKKYSHKANKKLLKTVSSYFIINVWVFSNFYSFIVPLMFSLSSHVSMVVFFDR